MRVYVYVYNDYLHMRTNCRLHMKIVIGNLLLFTYLVCPATKDNGLADNTSNK